VGRANEATEHVTRLLQDFQIGEAVRAAHEFLRGEYCDWYLEIAKVELRIAETEEQREGIKTNLAWVFEHTLRLLHPMMPFVTEALWQMLVRDQDVESWRPERNGHGVPSSIMVAPWPTAGERNVDAERRLDALMELVRGVRNLRIEYRVDKNRQVPATIVAAGADAAFFQEAAQLIGDLPECRLKPVEFATQVDATEQCATVVAGTATLYVPLAGLFDVEQERARLTKERGEVQAEIARSEALLSKPGFVDRAPAPVVQKERDKLAGLQDRLSRLDTLLSELG
jgi:valyl-tRNA synthetase